MRLNYGYTCGDIDSNIQDFKSDLWHQVESILENYNPDLTGEDRKTFIRESCLNIYNDNEAIFENVRKCNEDMRQQAELQISDLERDKDEVEELNGEKDDRINELEYDLRILEDRCTELERENQILQNEN